MHSLEEGERVKFANFPLPERDHAAVLQVIGDHIDYAVPADLSLEGKKTDGFFVIGGGKWAYVADGLVHEWRKIQRFDRLQIDHPDWQRGVGS